MNESWKVTLLGGLVLQHGDTRITRFRTQKFASLLAYLAYFRDRAHSREVLYEMLWPEAEGKAGRANLSVALSSLRHQLEPPGTPSNSVLRADYFSVAMNPTVVSTDVALFESEVAAAEKAASTVERIQSLSRAVDLYRGRLLPGFYEDWIGPEQERLDGLFFDSAGRLIELLEESGDLQTAITYSRKAVSVDPLREEGQQHLIRLLAAAGQPGLALRQYKELERLLEDELGAEPSPTLRSLYRRIERDTGILDLSLSPAPSRSPKPPSQKSVGEGEREGTVTLTFLQTDIPESTRLWEERGDEFRTALEEHRAALRREFARFDGQEIQETGDSFLVAFQSAGIALACAVACQQALRRDEGGGILKEELSGASSSSPIPHPSFVAVRMALHTGDVEAREGGYRGITLHHLSRILTAGHGGQILCSEVTAGLVRRDLPEDVRLVDLGVWQLRDIPNPERLFQVEHPGMPDGFAPLAAESGHANNLPLRFTRFFGRNQEIQRLVELLGARREAQGTSDKEGAPHAPRLITLTGPGGTGKTRLAIEAAESLLEPYQNAVWFVPLAALSNPELIPGAILDSMRIPRSPQQEPLEQAVAALSRQPSVLILDNVEHLLRDSLTRSRKDAQNDADSGARASGRSGDKRADSGTQGHGGTQKRGRQQSLDAADLVRILRERVPELRILATSRRILGLIGEQQFPVPALPTPNTEGQTPSTERLYAYDAVRLFIDRAQQVRPDFQVSNANAPAVAALCDRLEGIPLAIELAAARAQVFTPAQMLKQIEDRFGFLVSRTRDANERHRSLEAAVDWSYRLLTRELQRFFARLSVFRGGWSVEGAEAVCEAPLALDYLAELRECSLVLSEESEQGMRFQMLETLREYARERLAEAGEEVVLGRRHAGFFLDLAEQAEPELQGPDQVQWLERLETEHDNLRAALAWCLTSMAEGKREEDTSFILHPSSFAAFGLRLAGALGQFWLVRGHLSEGRAYLMVALSHTDLQERTLIRARALNRAGALVRLQGDYEAAGALFEESLAINRELGDSQGIASSLFGLGNIAMLQGDYRTARTLFEESLAIRRELGDRQSIGVSLNNLGNIAGLQRDYGAARSLYEESLAIRREVGDKQGIGISLGNLGNIAFRQGEYGAAKSLTEESLAICRELGDRLNIAHSLHNLGNVAFVQADYGAASALYEESLAIKRELGDKRGIARSLNDLGNVAKDQGDLEIARTRYKESLLIAQEMRDKILIAVALENLGEIARRQGDDGAARTLTEESLAIHREIGDRSGEAGVLDLLGELAIDQGDYALARSRLKEGLSIQRELGERRNIVGLLESCSALAAAQAESERMVRLRGAAEALREEMGMPIPPNEREKRERQIEEAREALGEEAFAVARDAGRAMTWEQAVEYALSLDPE